LGVGFVDVDEIEDLADVRLDGSLLGDPIGLSLPVSERSKQSSNRAEGLALDLQPADGFAVRDLRCGEVGSGWLGTMRVGSKEHFEALETLSEIREGSLNVRCVRRFARGCRGWMDLGVPSLAERDGEKDNPQGGGGQSQDTCSFPAHREPPLECQYLVIGFEQVPGRKTRVSDDTPLEMASRP
jgi:hypothetical protein